MLAMTKTGNKRKWRRTLPLLLAALLWAEGTLGNVCAAPETVSENTAVPVPEETGNPAEEENAAPEETGNPAEGESSAPEETEKPTEEDTAPEETEETAVSENTVSENTTEGEEEEIPADWSGEPTVGEPPLMTETEGGYGINTYSSVSPQAEGIRHKTPGVGEIIERYETYPWSLNVPNSYSEEPSVKAPYLAGHLTDNSLENAQNLLNFIRYVAGVPADVTLNEDYTEKAQAGALLNRVNGKLDHKPTKPEGFPEELYQTGYEGCSKGNLAAGSNYSNIAKSLLNGWMYDGDSSNINTMGHRRWVLNPSMTQTGFGAVDSYSAMYAFDSQGSGITDYVA